MSNVNIVYFAEIASRYWHPIKDKDTVKKSAKRHQRKKYCAKIKKTVNTTKKEFVDTNICKAHEIQNSNRCFQHQQYKLT